MRLPAEERYQSDKTFSYIVDTLYFLLCQNDVHGIQFTPTELREAAMLAAEKYEYTHIRPMFIRERAQELSMFGGEQELSMFGGEQEVTNAPPRTVTGSDLL